VWMLGTMLQHIIDALDPAPGDERDAMMLLAIRIRTLEVTTVAEVLADPWLAASGPEDLDALRLLIYPLFLDRGAPGRPAADAPAAEEERGERFAADVGLVDTRRGWWRVFEVGAENAGRVAVGERVLKVDGKDPKQRPALSGAFYSEMVLEVGAPEQGEPEQRSRAVVLRRTRLERAARAEADWERFRRYLGDAGDAGAWPEGGRFLVEELRGKYVR
jgi:hypothetical protein